MNADTSNECFLLTMSGVPVVEIARLKDEDPGEVQRAIEQEVARRVDVTDFYTLSDAIEYLRLDRIQRGMWAAATQGAPQQAQQVTNLIEKRKELRKSNRRERSLSEAVRDMMSENNVDLNEESEDE